MVHRHRRDHGTAREERRQRVQQLASPVQHADAGRCEHLVPGERGEIDTERHDVDRQMGHRLARVEHDERAGSAGERDDRLDGVHDADHVRHVRDRDDAGALADEVGRDIEPQSALVVDGDVPQGGAGTGRELLPGDEIGVVLEFGHDDLVACAEPESVRFGPTATCRGVPDRVGDEVQRLGRVGGPDDLVVLCTDEARDRAARVLERLGGLGRQRVRAPMHGGVPVLVVVALGVEDDPRLLTRCPGVEIGEGCAVDRLAEQREVGAQRDRLRVGQR